MTTLAIGASVTVNVGSDSSCKIFTNGGLASISVTPTGGVTTISGIGPLPVRQTFGPFATGATLVISNQTAVLDYSVPGFDPANVAITGGSISGLPVNLVNSLRNWRIARAKVINGTADAVIACVGDSKTFGRGANAADYSGCKSKAYPRQLANLLTAAGVAARDSSTMGTGRAGFPNYLLAENRVSAGAGWAEFTSDSIGGFMTWNNTDTSTLAFTPTQTMDTIEIYDVTNYSQGQWTVNVDGGAALATVNAGSGGNQLRKTTVTPVRGTHTVNIQRTGTGSYIIIPAIITRDSLARSVLVHNMGSSGSQASFWNTSANAWSPIPVLQAIAPNLTIINLGTNEWINATNPSVYFTNMQALITAALVSGDVLLIAPSYSIESLTPKAQQDAIIAQCYALASVNNLSLIDHSMFIGPFAAANTAGMYFDNTHESGAGYADEAKRIAALLLA